MSDPKQARVLLEAAERDVLALRGMGDAAVFTDEIFGFHVQQAVEKLYKTQFVLRGEPYPGIHDLRKLLERLTARESNAARFRRQTDYTPYAVRYRYGADDAEAGSLDRGEVLRQVEVLLAAVRRRLMEEEGD